MALALRRLPGYALALTITGAGTITAWEKLTINTMHGKFECTAADADYIQKVLGQRDSTGSLSGFLGTEGNPGSEGDVITVINVSVGADEVTPADIDNATVWGKIRITKVTREYQKEPGKFSIEWESGFID